MRILAIDPGYDRMGVAVLEKPPAGGRERLLHSECFSPTGRVSPEKRTLLIGRKIAALLKKYRPAALVLERVFFNKNQKTALLVAEVRGVLIYQALSAGLEVFQLTPLQVKVAVTGWGRSDKRQLAQMVKRLIAFPKPETVAPSDDETDAIAIGLAFFALGDALRRRR